MSIVPRMLTTYELRWFSPGKVPDNIKLWFEQRCLINPSSPPEERSDVYLYSPENSYLGIKLRQGRLDVKWRKAEIGVVKFGEFAEGNVEKWGKWLCYDPTEESFQPNQVLSNPTWVSVKKVRYSQLYQILPDFSPQPISADQSIENGCSVELTHIMIHENPWWTLAFEASGEDNRLMDNLQATANLVFNSYNGTKLQVRNSYGYPSWLSLVNL